MKQLLSIILILIFSLQAYSQKKSQQKAKSKTVSSKQVEEIKEAPPKMEKAKIDTLYIPKGKPYFLLVDINKYSGNTYTDYANDNNSEEAELKRNFTKEELNIILIHKYTYVIFENKKALDISSEGESYQIFCYWSGNVTDNLQAQEGTRMATEFVSKHMGGNKESSYNINARRYKKETASLQNRNKITSKSKEVMISLLKNYILPARKFDDYRILFNLSTAKVKTIESYLEENGNKTHLRTIYLNENGLPTLIKNYDKEKVESERSFIYKDGMLTKIMSGEKIASNVNYDNEKMILSGTFTYADETEIYWLENGKLLRKWYSIMKDDQSSYMNTFAEDKIEKDCTLSYINNRMWTKNCSSQINIFPYIDTYTSFQDDKVLQFRKSKIEKKADNVFEKYFSDSESPEQKDNLKLFGTFHLNKYNLVTNYNFTKDKNNKSIKIEYTYY